MLGAREHEHGVELLLPQQLYEQLALPVARHRIDRVRDGVGGLGAEPHLHDDGLAQILPRERLDLGRHRRAEEQRLPVFRDFGDDAIELRREAHVEHAIGLVEHEHFEIVEGDVLALHVVEQPAGGGDDDVDAGTQCLLLRTERNAAVHHGDLQPAVLAYRAKVSLTCTASSRVGVRMSARVRRGPPRSRCTIGSVKAAVLPVPVCASPMMSRPRRMSGIARA